MFSVRSSKSPRSRRRNLNRRGLTLIELVVVLTILTALGGLLVPVIGGMIARTHFAKCSATIPEITEQISRSFTSDLRYPDQFDSLINDDGTTLYTKIPGGDAGGNSKTITLTQEQVDGLNALGITRVVDLDDQIDGDATWDVAEIGKTPRVLVAGGTVAALVKPGEAGAPAPTAVEGLNLKRHLVDATTEYIVMGIGNNSTAVGPTGLFVEAPTHFGGEDAMNPREFYQRYCVIFSVNADGDVFFETACSVHPDGYDGAEAHVRGFYDETAN